MKPDEIRKLERYLKALLGGADVKVKAMPKQKDTAELYIADEFVGTINKDTDEGEVSYPVTITILDVDLD